MPILVRNGSNEPVNIGDSVQTFRGEEAILLSFSPPRHSGSTGRVEIQIGEEVREFYPSVIDCHIQEG